MRVCVCVCVCVCVWGGRPSPGMTMQEWRYRGSRDIDAADTSLTMEMGACIPAQVHSAQSMEVNCDYVHLKEDESIS